MNIQSIEARITLATILGALALPSWSQVANVYTRDANGQVVSDQQIDSAVVAPYRADYGLYGGTQSSTHTGQAVASTQTLRAEATLRSAHPSVLNSFSAKTEVSFEKVVRVLPGNTGLALGAPVSITADLRFDGAAAVGDLDDIPGTAQVTTAGDRTLTSADISLRYVVRDLDQIVCGEGCRPRQLLRFGFEATLDRDARFETIGGSSAVTSSWTNGTLLSGTPTPNPVNLYTDGAFVLNSTSLATDTGWLRFSFDTFIGNRLEIDASLDVFLQAAGKGLPTAGADGLYRNTFDAELGGSVSGLEFLGEVAGTAAPIPEPASVALLLAGLAAVGGASRRRGRA